MIGNKFGEVVQRGLTGYVLFVHVSPACLQVQ